MFANGMWDKIREIFCFEKKDKIREDLIFPFPGSHKGKESMYVFTLMPQ